MNTEQMLLAAIHADPFDRTAWLALGDWLEEDGQIERGELLRLQLRLGETLDGPARPAWESRVQHLLAQGVRPCVPQLWLSLGAKAALVASLVPAGTFWMGDDPPRVRVTLTRPFYIGIYPVTQAQWWALMRRKPARFPGPERPAEQVNYEDCRSFCKKLGEKTGRVVRLPSEAEWECACRAGTTSKYCSGNEEADLARVAWDRGDHTHPVGGKQPNAFGLYDMHGNVWEWCRDVDGPYPEDGSIDPVRDHSSAARICKGGSYGNPTRAGNRIGFMAGGRNDFIGCRVVVEWQRGEPGPRGALRPPA